jgi:hypothetical protein
MKTPLLVALIIVTLVGSLAGFLLYDRFILSPGTGSTSPGGGSNSNGGGGGSTSPSSCSDPASISSHVYHPYRLQIVKPCITASGTVDRVLQEADGDVHVRTKLDQAYSNLTNSANDQYQYGDLVVEIICVTPPTQTDAIPACQNYTSRIPVPSAGQHITITGPYVLDTNHYNWAEIHPVYTLAIG